MNKFFLLFLVLLPSLSHASGFPPEAIYIFGAAYLSFLLIPPLLTAPILKTNSKLKSYSISLFIWFVALAIAYMTHQLLPMQSLMFFLVIALIINILLIVVVKKNKNHWIYQDNEK